MTIFVRMYQDPTPFRRQHPVTVFVLFVVTLGVYGGVWLRRQARDFDPRLPAFPLRRFSTITLALCVGDLLLFLGDLAIPEGTLRGMTGATSALASGLLLLGALRVRRRIIYLAAEQGALRPKVSLLATVLLNAAYLQAKINRYADSLRSSGGPPLLPPFRDSRRLAWMASLGPALVPAVILLTIFTVPIGIEWIGTSVYQRARDRALNRLSPLPTNAGAVPEIQRAVLGLGAAVEIADAEKDKLDTVLDTVGSRRPSPEDQRFFRSLLERNNENLARISTFLDDPAGRTDFTEEADADSSLLPQRTVAQLLLASGLLEIESGYSADAIPAIRRLGSLARLFEHAKEVTPQLLSADVERHQLVLVSAAMDACLDGTAAQEVASTLLDRPMEQRLHELLAHDAATFIEFERSESRELTEDLLRGDGSLIARRAGARVARGFLRYSMAGALDSLVLNADIFGGGYGEMRTALEPDIDKMTFLQKARSLAGRFLWILPATLRVVGDSRLGAAHALRGWGEPGRTACGGELPGDGRLEELYLTSRGDRGCELRYRLREDILAAVPGEFDLPPLSWPLGCRPGALNDR